MISCQTARIQVSDAVKRDLAAIAPKHADPNMQHLFSLPPTSDYEIRDAKEDVAGIYPVNESEPICLLPGRRADYDLTDDLRGFHVWRRKASGTRDARTGTPSLAEINRRNREFYKRK